MVYVCLPVYGDGSVTAGGCGVGVIRTWFPGDVAVLVFDNRFKLDAGICR